MKKLLPTFNKMETNALAKKHSHWFKQLKNSSFVIVLGLITAFIFSSFQSINATTYYWIGGATATDFAILGNWSTTLGGSANTTALASTDVFIFDGSNIGSGATGAITITAWGSSILSIGGLILQNGANVAIPLSTSRAITIGDNVTGYDFSIGSSCKLALGDGGTYTISMSSTATGSISGELDLGLAGTKTHVFTSPSAGGITVNSGGVVSYNVSSTGKPFGTTPAGGWVFANGSTCKGYKGGDIFNGSTNVITFQTGSTYEADCSSSASYPMSVATADQTYSNFVYNSTATPSSKPLLFNVTVDNLILATGQTTNDITIDLALKTLTVKGAVVNNSAKNLLIANNSAAGTGNLTFGGTSTQNIYSTSTGTISFGNTTAGDLTMINVGNPVVLGDGGSNLGNLSIAALGTLNLTSDLTTGSSTLTVNGTTTGAGNIVTSNTGTIAYGGTVAQTISNLKNNTVNNLTISNAAGVTPGVAITVTGATTVNASALLRTGSFTFTNSGTTSINGSFQIDEGGWATGNSFTYGTAGTLVFNNSSAPYSVGSTTVFWPATNGPVNVTVQNTGGLLLQASQTVTGIFQTSTGITNTFGNNLTVSGSVKLNSGGYFGNFSPTYTNTGTLVYNTTGTYGVNNEWGAGSTAGYGVPQNVSVLNGTTVNLLGSKTVPGTLAFTSGKLTLGANNLTVGAITGGSATNYVVTDGAGILTQPIAAARTVVFPIGASTSSYDPVSVTPVSATNFSARAYFTLTGAVPTGYSYNAKEWNLSSDAPSSTSVTLTPSTVTALGANSVIGHYDGTNYVNVPATLATGSYTATFTSFSPFVTGATDLGTGINPAAITGVSFDGQIIHNNTNADLQVFDATGRLMVSSNKNVDMNSYSKGVYVVKSNSGTLKISLRR